ncbi:glycosyltransferase [Limosilactobacillus sp.]|uniref:glycosyltransferase n=1 Tax=Limosilactobacillus sp. TaxID=2773925 RepID=UPI00345E6C49
MQLTFICPEMNGNGGTETVVAKVVNHLVNDNHVTLVLTSIPTNKQWLSSINSNVDIMMVHHDGKVHKAMLVIKALMKQPNDAKVIVLAANLIKLVAKYRQLLHRHWKLISWIHYSLTHQPYFDPRNILVADEHWAISSPIKDKLIEMGADPSSVKLIFNPIDDYSGPLNQPSNGTINLVYVGRIMFDGQKNLHELLLGIEQLKHDEKDIHLTLFGSGDDLALCKKFAKDHGIAECLDWYGWTKDPWSVIVKQIHPQALVLTSKFEGLPMVMLEAMSRGIPCVCSDFDGYGDVLQDNVNGYVYKLGNINSLRAKMLKVLPDDLSPQKVKNSVVKFSQREYFSRLIAIIKG